MRAAPLLFPHEELRPCAILPSPAKGTSFSMIASGCSAGHPKMIAIAGDDLGFACEGAVSSLALNDLARG
jgi:hypothetical protein